MELFMKKYLLFSLIIISSLLNALNNDPPKDKVVCVVSGDEINKKDLKDHEFSAYKDGKVYFCCGGCKMDYDETPAKFSTKANFQLVSTGQYVQSGCPVTGQSPGHNHHKKEDFKYVTVEGLSVELCCAGCLKKVNKSKDKFSMLFSDKSFKKGFDVPVKKSTKSKK